MEGRVPTRDYDQIYLNEDRFDEPKESFKALGAHIRARLGEREGLELLDVGCATGELIWHLRTILPTWKFAGLDLSPAMVDFARSKMPDVSFESASILDGKFSRDRARQYDVVTCNGFMDAFDDWVLPLHNILSCVKPGGWLFCGVLANDDPVDVNMRYRHVHDGESQWRIGFNVLSKKTFVKIVTDFDPAATVEWTLFEMPFAIAKGRDPMRSWTIRTEAQEFQTVNGAGQLLNLYFAAVRRSG